MDNFVDKLWISLLTFLRGFDIILAEVLTVKNFFGKIKPFLIKFISYMKVDTKKKLAVFAVSAAVIVMLAAAAGACIDIFRESNAPEPVSTPVDLNKITDGTQNGINIIKRKPKSEPKAKNDAKAAADEDLSQYINTHDDAAAYTEKATRDEQIESMISEMPLGEKVYQMMFVTPEALCGKTLVTECDDAVKEGLSTYPVGGIILFSDNLSSKNQVSKLNADLQSTSKIPLFIGIDEEGGSVSRLGSNHALGFEKQPSAEEIGKSGDPSAAYSAAAKTAEGMKNLGFNLDFAPVADVNSDEMSQIGDRAFSDSFDGACAFVSSYVSGLKDGGIVSVLKHFPGIGSASADTHKGRAEITESFDSMRKNEFQPFISGIHAGADFVMISHASPNCTTEKSPSSLSSEVVSGWLRGKLNFSGVTITDSLSMRAITDEYTTAAASVKAVSAGCDMLLMPKDLTAAHSAIVSAVKSGEITEEHIDSSVRRILAAKKKRGII